MSFFRSKFKKLPHRPRHQCVQLPSPDQSATAFLLSDLSSGITSEIMYVDGGYSQGVGVTADQI